MPLRQCVQRRQLNTVASDELGLISTAHECDILAESVPDNAGVYAVSAFTGLGAPIGTCTPVRNTPASPRHYKGASRRALYVYLLRHGRGIGRAALCPEGGRRRLRQ